MEGTHIISAHYLLAKKGHMATLHFKGARKTNPFHCPQEEDKKY